MPIRRACRFGAVGSGGAAPAAVNVVEFGTVGRRWAVAGTPSGMPL